MKTFEEIIDNLWKPYKVYTFNKNYIFKSNGWKEQKNKVLVQKISYSSTLSKPFYGKDINEPTVKICKRILEKPERFSLNAVNWHLSHKVYGVTDNYVEELLDLDTRVIFRFNHMFCTTPDMFSIDESELLSAVVKEWFIHTQEVQAIKNEKLAQERKDKLRKEMIELYKDL